MTLDNQRNTAKCILELVLLVFSRAGEIQAPSAPVLVSKCHHLSKECFNFLYFLVITAGYDGVFIIFIQMLNSS